MRRLAIAMSIILLAGCGRQPDGVNLRYMVWGTPEQIEVEQKLVDEFEKQNPNIHVRIFQTPSSAYKQKMILMLASRTAPDVLRVDHYDFPSLVEKDYFADMSGYAASDPGYHASDFYPQAIQECTYKGRLYGLNSMLGGVIMYYNKTLFEKCGLEDPCELAKQGTWTWDMFRQDAMKMTSFDANGRAQSYGCLCPSTVITSSIVVRAFGGTLLSQDERRCTMDSPQAIQAYQFLADLRWKDHSCPTPSEVAMSAFEFESGRVGMEFDFMGVAPILRRSKLHFKWDICPIPKGPAGDHTILKGNQICVSIDSPHKAEAWKLIRFLTSPPIEQYYYGELRRGAPSRKAVAEAKKFLETTQPPYNTWVYLTAVKGGLPLPINNRWPEWTDAVNSALEPLWNGTNKNVPDVLRKATAKANEILSSEEGL